MTLARKWNDLKPWIKRSFWEMLLACFLAGLFAAVIHLIARDSTAHTAASSYWKKSSFHRNFDGFPNYRREIWTIVIAGGIALLAWGSIPVLRFIRSWRIGITSLAVIGCFLAVSSWLCGLTHGIGRPLAFFSIAIIWFYEAFLYLTRITRADQRRSQYISRLRIPSYNYREVLKDWEPDTSDNSIDDWKKDAIGRSGLIDLLARHIFVLRTPVIALQGAYGNGKSSILGLLNSSLGQEAIVVAFNTWLPSSKENLIDALFHDIAVPIGRKYFMPRLRSRLRSYARIIGGAVPSLGILKEIFSTDSQVESINELKLALSSLPIPVIVFLDEIDRMQPDEQLVLLKALRGASSLPNITFICAFDHRAFRDSISADSQFLEKFFPVSVEVTPPTASAMADMAIPLLASIFSDEDWFLGDADRNEFQQQLEAIWNDALSKICTNLRQLSLLYNDVRAAISGVAFEVHPIDAVIVEALRRFVPDIYHILQKRGIELTQQGYIPGYGFVTKEMQATRSSSAIAEIISALGHLPDYLKPSATLMLHWLFPVMEKERSQNGGFLVIRHSNQRRDYHRAISNADYFALYFQSSLPQTSFSNLAFKQFIRDVKDLEPLLAKTEFSKMYFNTLADASNRQDFLRRLCSETAELIPVSSRMLFAETLSEKSDLLYSSHDGGISEALRFILHLARMMSSHKAISPFLEHCIGRAGSDQFSFDVFNFLLDEGSGEYQVRSSRYVDKEELKRVFVERMRRRYTVLKLAPEPLSLYPFRLWANFSESDRQSCRALFSTYIKGDIHRLLSVLATFMPIGIWPDRTPIEFLDDALDVTEVKDAIENIRDDELTREERVVLHRVWDAFNGIYMKGSEFPDSLSRFKEESDQYLKVYDIDHSSVQTSPTWPFKDMFQMEDPV